MFKNGDTIIRSLTNKIAELQKKLEEKEKTIQGLIEAQKCLERSCSYQMFLDIQKQLKEKEKYTYTGKEIGEIERKYDEKIDTLEQKLKSQLAEIVEKIKEQIFNHFNVKNIEEYDS